MKRNLLTKQGREKCFHSVSTIAKNSSGKKEKGVNCFKKKNMNELIFFCELFTLMLAEARLSSSCSIYEVSTFVGIFIH